MTWKSAVGLDTVVQRWRGQLAEGALALEDRVALAKLELIEQRQRLILMATLAVVLAAVAVVVFLLLSMALMVQFWDSPLRTTVGWCIAGFWTLLWVVGLLCLRKLAAQSGHPFALTRAELSRDWDALKGRL